MGGGGTSAPGSDSAFEQAVPPAHRTAAAALGPAGTCPEDTGPSAPKLPSHVQTEERGGGARFRLGHCARDDAEASPPADPARRRPLHQRQAQGTAPAITLNPAGSGIQRRPRAGRVTAIGDTRFGVLLRAGADGVTAGFQANRECWGEGATPCQGGGAQGRGCSGQGAGSGPRTCGQDRCASLRWVPAAGLPEPQAQTHRPEQGATVTSSISVQGTVRLPWTKS